MTDPIPLIMILLFPILVFSVIILIGLISTSNDIDLIMKKLEIGKECSKCHK